MGWKQKIVLAMGRDNKQQMSVLDQCQQRSSRCQRVLKRKRVQFKQTEQLNAIENAAEAWIGLACCSKVCCCPAWEHLDCPQCAQIWPVLTNEKSCQIKHKSETKQILGRVDVAQLRGDTVTQSGWGLTLLARLTRLKVLDRP